MSITFTGPGGLFTRIGAALQALDDANLSEGTTIPNDIAAVLEELPPDSTSLAIQAIGAQLSASGRGGGTTQAAVQRFVRDLIIEQVIEDNPQPSRDLTLCLQELIRQMIDQAETVENSTPSVTVTAGSANVGDGIVIASTKRGDGLVNENMFAEDIVLRATTSGTAFTAQGELAVANKLSPDWPAGSGTTASVPVTDALSDGLLNNGSFETDDDIADAPDGWDTPLATIGTTLKVTDVEVQTVAISGTPASGSYTLTYTDADGRVQITERLAYNATSTAVQTALRALEGLELVTVSQTGTTPNFTHTITFTGVKGNVTQLTSTSNLNTGSIAHNTTTTGNTNTYAGGRSLEFASNGSQLTSIQQKVEVLALTQYAFNCFMKVSAVPSAGVMRVSLWDGEVVINDEQGNANSLTIDCTALTTSFAAQNAFFRLPKNLPPIVYLRIEITTAVDNAKSVYLDHAALVQCTKMYDGGPEAASFAGATAFIVGNAQNDADNITLTVGNDYAGEIQLAFERLLDMNSKALLLPSA